MWEKRVKRWKSSGLSAAEFADGHGYRPEQLYWWSWKLGMSSSSTRQSAGDEPTLAVSEEPRFLPVHVVEPSPPSMAPAAVPLAPAWIEIALPNGGVVRLLPGVDAATIACVMTAVARLSC
jgi:hypothetical protein